MNDKLLRIIVYSVIILLLIIAIYLIGKINLNPQYTEATYCNDPSCLNKNKDCGLMDSRTITKCATNSDCSSCMGNLSCQNLQNTIIDIPQGKCVSPMIWNNNKCYIPADNYCVPYNIPDIDCNSFTGTKILSKVGIDDPYQWNCICKNNSFTGPNCDQINICGMNGQTNEDMLNNNNISENSKTYLTNSDGSYWSSSSDWDPNIGICKCGLNQVADNSTKTCLPSLCSPCSPLDVNKCICPNNGYLDCYTDLAYTVDPIFGSYINGSCTPGTAVPDPCAAFEGDTANVYDPSTNTCKCDTTNGYFPVQTSQVSIGQKCVNLCDIQNPCASRGSCYVVSDDSKDKQSLWNFDVQCSNNDCYWLIHNNSGYLINDGGNINISSSGTLFIIEPICGTTNCVPMVSQMTNNNKYKLKDKDGNYLCLDNNILSFNKTGTIVTWTYYITNDEAINNKNITSGRILVVDNLFLGLLLDSGGVNKISLNPIYKGTARCKDCISPYMQDYPNQMCNTRCLPDGSKCSGYCGSGDSAPCCSIYCEHQGCPFDCGQRCNGSAIGELSSDPMGKCF